METLSKLGLQIVLGLTGLELFLKKFVTFGLLG